MANIKAPAHIAEIAQNLGVARFIHVSCLNADPKSKSAVYSTKGKAENFLKANYPNTTIVRPATMFGYEDQFLTNIGYWKDLYLTVNGASNIVRPVDVEDVARSIHTICENEWTAGKVFELYNPNEYTQKDIIDMVSLLLYEKVNAVDVPPKLLRLAARVLDILPYHYSSHHEVDMMGIDEVPSIDSEVYTFADLGITPHPIEIVALKYIRHYRKFENEKLPMEISSKAFRK
ncbi:NADH-ubiquinone oxidoreductase 40 kDa subunit, mitochondrial [Smittium mucronatum]|uniref:NADH-ubiquinone oxidoreductase 40 kDa subunit, mitochondrial n=1 Tax=Smittium mucronatum TaxID=133383 RepID=A0A1R0H1L0_9FUNG|nr:NADH-ubiquinone oxidoreductase 40 kDa subunit, mitochondrial [Smittium mucronatum]